MPAPGVFRTSTVPNPALEPSERMSTSAKPSKNLPEPLERDEVA